MDINGLDKSYHPCIKTAKTPGHWITYITKEDKEPLDYNFPNWKEKAKKEEKETKQTELGRRIRDDGDIKEFLDANPELIPKCHNIMLANDSYKRLCV